MSTIKTCLVIAAAFALGAVGKEAPNVSTKVGQVSGIVEKSFENAKYFSYKGIPFAEPPLNDLRFKVTFHYNSNIQYLNFGKPSHFRAF